MGGMSASSMECWDPAAEPLVTSSRRDGPRGAATIKDASGRDARPLLALNGLDEPGGACPPPPTPNEYQASMESTPAFVPACPSGSVAMPISGRNRDCATNCRC
jgi:hypothetical protein